MRAPLVVVMGASWGGVDALQKILASLPPDWGLAMLVVLHRMDALPDMLLDVLRRVTTLPVDDVEDKDAILGGHIYVAPSGYHVLMEDGHFVLSVDEPVKFARPSINVAMSAAAEAEGPNVVGVLLTGAGRDGAEGLAEIKRMGGRVIVQEPTTAARSDMPEAALDAVEPDKVLPLELIGPYLAELS